MSTRLLPLPSDLRLTKSLFGQTCSPRFLLRGRISDLYMISERSNHLFSSPLGPGNFGGEPLHIPRFVYFGPHAHDESLRLAFYGGEDAEDLRGSHALIHLLEQLALDPGIGQGLNLSVVPLVDSVETLGGAKAYPSGKRVDWSQDTSPVVELLRKDIRHRAYHGFIRVQSASVNDLTVQLRSQAENSTGVEWITSQDFEPLEVRWQGFSATEDQHEGPLTLSGDLPFHAFELVLRVPHTWSDSLYVEGISFVLRRFILRYRGLQAYGQNL